MSFRTALYVSTTGWTASATLAGAHAEAGVPDWAAMGAALRERHGRTRAHLLLSARQCRFLVLPWIPACRSGSAIRAYVADAFAESAQIGAGSHRIEIDWPAWGAPILASAYPRALVESAQAALAAAGHRLLSVDSSIGPVMRRHGRSLDGDPALLAYADDDGVVGITIEGGRVVQVESVPTAADGLDELPLWCARKRFAFADDAQLRWLDTTAMPDAFSGVPLTVANGAAASSGQAMVAAWR